MEDQARPQDRPLSVRLDLRLDQRPVRGRLRTDQGAVEQFVGWLGFVEALRRLSEAQSNERS